MAVVLDGGSLTLDELVRVARENAPVELSPHAVERMREARALVERSLERGDEVYGMTTGVGARKKVRVAANEIASFNRALIANHLVGVGPDAPVEIVRATMLRLANALAKGTTGVRPETAERILTALNTGEHPGCACSAHSARPTSRRWPTSRTASSPTPSWRRRRASPS